jgi:hypothetical protein
LVSKVYDGTDIFFKCGEKQNFNRKSERQPTGRQRLRWDYNTKNG